MPTTIKTSTDICCHIKSFIIFVKGGLISDNLSNPPRLPIASFKCWIIGSGLGTSSISITANGNYTFSTTFSRDTITFSANDLIQTAIYSGGTSTFDVDNLAGTVDIQVDT